VTDTQLSASTVSDLLERLSSSAPVPGGGSAAALAGALGASLVAMVCELTVGRAAYADAEPIAREAGEAARELRDELMELAERDAAAYDAVVRARKLPRESEAEQAARSAAIDAASVIAAEVPLQVARVAVRVLDLAERIAPVGNRNAVSDAGVAALLAAAAIRGAVLNVRINLPYLPAGTALAGTAPGMLAELEATAATAETAALAAVAARLG
jgi:glutamate formiminotransferase/formiminotetrahydrofolate cyclodeaminase